MSATSILPVGYFPDRPCRLVLTGVGSVRKRQNGKKGHAHDESEKRRTQPSVSMIKTRLSRTKYEYRYPFTRVKRCGTTNRRNPWIDRSTFIDNGQRGRKLYFF